MLVIVTLPANATVGVILLIFVIQLVCYQDQVIREKMKDETSMNFLEGPKVTMSEGVLLLVKPPSGT